MSRTYWKIFPSLSPEKPVICSREELIRQLLHNRGITEPSQSEVFLSADSRLQADPFLLPDMFQAVNRTYRALLSGETIAIYGDFDADGVTATALLVEGLSALGGNVIPYIPHRLQDGYGVRVQALQQLRQQGVSLVITVDCGISAVEEAKEARRMGLDMIITDHHLPTTSLPPALAVVDPRRTDSTYPSPGLAGVGVAFKLLQAIVKGGGREQLLQEILDLVAIGTVTDMAPLVGENRYLVSSGLKALNTTKRLGLAELIRCAGIEPGGMESSSISWVLGPRLNAAGRVDHAITSYKLLTTRVPEEATRLAHELDNKNIQRQVMTAEVLQKAREKLTAAGTDAPVLIVKDENYLPGIIGVVAGRLSEQFYRPVVLIKTGAEVCRGSARSIPEFDLVAALKDCEDLLVRFGGHSMAAGFSVSVNNLTNLEKRLAEVAAGQLAGVDMRPHLTVDAEVPLSLLEGESYELVRRLAPFGSGNPLPTFVSRNVKVEEVRNVGSQGEHISFRLRQGDSAWPAMGFRLGSQTPKAGSLLDIVYNLDLNRWNGEKTLRLNLLDLELSSPPQPGPLPAAENALPQARER